VARKRAVGSNQYKQRAGSVLAPVGDLVGQVGSSDRRRCGDVWGTECQVWVWAPAWSHGKHGLDGDRLVAANNIICLPVALALLAQDAESDVRAVVATNPSVPSYVVDRLAVDENVWVRSLVASNPDTPMVTLALLAGDEDQSVRWQVANHPNIPPEVLAQLLADADMGVRQSVLDNPNLPDEYRLLHRVAR